MIFQRNRKCSDMTPVCGEMVAVGRRYDGEVDVAGFHQLQELRLRAESRARILVDSTLPPLTFFSLAENR